MSYSTYSLKINKETYFDKRSLFPFFLFFSFFFFFFFPFIFHFFLVCEAYLEEIVKTKGIER